MGVDASGLAKAEAKLPSQVLHLHRQAWWQSPSTLYEWWKSLLGGTQKKQQNLVCQERRQQASQVKRWWEGRLQGTVLARHRWPPQCKPSQTQSEGPWAKQANDCVSH